MLTNIDEYARPCTVVETRYRHTSEDVLHVPRKLFLIIGPPGNVRPDNDPEAVTRAARERV